ncbi:S-adenosyl-L-methionine-dependent methyltransferase [Plenodomus tracheiphilus IPT5]|uniref:S-adenosyl-L-methionine-dependent methyltransferase n=1 Tax=Plenodomus tracheiphilus IPT5 TaxID=1408161 RepID=A0A6A7B0Y2_9PLEO|nr:S-adenosyl-L-methionine-dependent methyltransferase [Plenodomus tracheiphilus IPT5]
MAETPSFNGLASIISENAQVIEQYLSSSDQIPKPTLDPNGPHHFPAPPDAFKIQMARENLLDAVRRLQLLALGPVEALFQLSSRSHELSVIHAIYALDMASKVPVDGEVSFAEIAKAVGIDEDRVTRIIRLAVTSGVFQEARPGFVSHTGMSSVLATNQGASDIFGMALEDEIGAIGHFVNALKKYPEPQNRLLETPFALAHNIDKPYYEWVSKDQRRVERFQRAMRANDSGGPFSSECLTHGYDWNALNAKLFVDMGGSMGHSTMRIANGSKIDKFIVQDFTAEEVNHAKAALPKEFEGRIEFAEHDFFKPQTIHGADVYFFRWILHNWPDPECIVILKNLVPAMKKGARVIISDLLLPEPNTVPNRLNREFRVMDIHMLNVFGARERDVSMFKDLFAAADPRFKFEGAKPLPGSLLSIVEAVWDP